ncbi:MAG: hypothetical protein Q8K02_10085 [Flavobacterium sp.]|nr:hypothetical protein [Flavobacterium sp.]
METILKSDFIKIMQSLVDFFNPKLNEYISQQYYNKLRWYPLNAFKYVVEFFIETRRPISSNFPTIQEMINICANWLTQNPHEKIKRTQYDPYDDPRYPIEKLWEGFNILTRFGKDKFQNFAQENKMPQQDIERVINKARMIEIKEKI